ncbi:DUF4148 domain-containing protein [Paraburkholderia sediminicola]|jgi:hypothetical protein|nr:DUF4148 domain-containing protein [Paraburkholderia sediminicola]
MGLGFSGNKIVLSLGITFALLIAQLAFAQGSSSDSASGATAASTGSSHSTASSTAAERRAQRKAARKEARAQRNVELKKLESSGYKPAQSDPNFPQHLQDAEQKAGATSGASQ